MPKYRKKPVVVEAIKVEPGKRDEVFAFVPERLLEFTEEGINITTLEGTMLARPGDYIIRGVAGEFYPCKPGIFEATYDKV